MDAHKKRRVEVDSMGEMEVPADAYWGAQTQRAVENFPVSGLTLQPRFIRALGLVKQAAARANRQLGLLDPRRADAIIAAAGEVVEGELARHFVVDVFQTGSGTSTNMNANEVIANRANETLCVKSSDEGAIHPNDHVNLGQSSNDVFPSCAHIALLEGLTHDLEPALARLEVALTSKAKEFDHVLKIGRTHLQDATPMRLGQAFGGYSSMVEHAAGRLDSAGRNLSELALGGTAVGTGINTDARFPSLAIDWISRSTGIGFREADNHFEAQGARDALVEASGAIKTVAVSLMKIANDIRWLGSGPRAGIGELKLPEVQPGSSIMPGKVNPVMAESLCQVAAHVIGIDAAVTAGGMSGNLELNVMMPMMTYNLLQGVELLTRSVDLFTTRCINGLEADEEVCRKAVESSLAMGTALAPHIGYDAVARIAKQAYESGRTVREVARELAVLPAEELERVLDPVAMTHPAGVDTD